MSNSNQFIFGNFTLYMFRLIEKFGFVLILIGYFLPFAFDKNIFQINQILIELRNIYGITVEIGYIRISLSLIFICSCIGSYLFFLQLKKNYYNIGLEIIIYFGIIMSLMILFCDILILLLGIFNSFEEIRNALKALNLAKDIGLKINILQIGINFIMIGLLLTLFIKIFMLIMDYIYKKIYLKHFNNKKENDNENIS